jgi:hypothetical protein
MTGPEHYIAAEELLAGSSQPVPSSAVWIANPGRAIRQNHRPVIAAPRSLRPCQSTAPDRPAMSPESGPKSSRRYSAPWSTWTPASSRRSRRTGSGSPLPSVSRPTSSTSHAREPRSAETLARGHAGADRRPQVLRAPACATWSPGLSPERASRLRSAYEDQRPEIRRKRVNVPYVDRSCPPDS